MADSPTIAGAFERGARWFPDKEVFVQGDSERDRSVSYADAAVETRRFAAGLGSLGVEPGDRVAFLTRSTVDHAIAYIGALRAGAIPATLHYRESPETVRAMVDAIEPVALVFQPQLEARASSIRQGCDTIAAWLALDRLGPVPSYGAAYTDVLGTTDASLPTVRPSDRAFINFSSGTTGVPKPVVHTHRDIIESAHLGAFKYRIRVDDRTLKTATPSFIAWANATFSHVNAGATLVYLQDTEPRTILSAIETEAVTSMITVPTIWRRLLEQDVGDFDLTSLRLAGYAGEPIGPELFERIQSVFTSNVCAVYGTTETMSSSLILFPEHVTEETLDTVGYPVPNTEVRVIDQSSRDPEAEVDRGEVGEVVIRGPSVAEEVWDDHEATRETFHEDGWVFTGDVGRVSERGFLSLVGRLDHTIISGGINVHPERVRRVIAEHPSVTDVAIVGVPDEDWGQAIAAAVVPADDTLTGDHLTDYCRDHPDLSDYQRPRRFLFLETLPQAGTGKVDYRALEELFGEPSA